MRFPLSLVAALVGAPLLAQGPPAKVTVTDVTKRVFRPKKTVLGEAEARREVEVSTEVAGLVSKLERDEGQNVRKGAVLLRLDTKLREIRKRAAQARLDTAEQQAAEYEKGSRPEEIEAAREAVKEATALLSEAQTELERQKGLIESRIGSAKALSAASALAESRAALLRKRQAELALVQAGPRAEVKARAAAQVALYQAQLDEIVDEIEKATIVAPFQGVLARKLTEEGAYLQRGQAVFRLVELDPIRVSISVPESLIARIRKGALLEVTLDAFPGGTFEGEVEAVLPDADKMTRAFPVKVLLANTGHKILPGMVARARIPTADGGEALAVPRDAVVRGPMGNVVYKVDGGAATPVPVRLGASDGTWVEIDGGLAAGDAVVVRGNESLRPGQKVIVLGSGAGEGRK